MCCKGKKDGKYPNADSEVVHVWFVLNGETFVLQIPVGMPLVMLGISLPGDNGGDESDVDKEIRQSGVGEPTL